MSFLVLDIETVPDLTKVKDFERYLDPLAKIEALLSSEKTTSVEAGQKVAAQNGSLCKTMSLDPALGKILSISALWIRKKKSGAFDIADTQTFMNPLDEKDTLSAFWAWISKNRIPCQTVTYNGLGFDLPFLFTRSMLNSVAIPWPDLGLRRFSVWPHFDVMCLVTFWGPPNRWKGLPYFAKLFGYDCDLNAEGGEMIAHWHSLGMYNEITKHNLDDCKMTYHIFQHMINYYKHPPRSGGRNFGPY